MVRRHTEIALGDINGDGAVGGDDAGEASGTGVTYSQVFGLEDVYYAATEGRKGQGRDV